MNGFLFDTHLLLRFGGRREMLPATAAALMADRANRAAFSVVSIVQVAIKFAQGRTHFDTAPTAFRADLLLNGFEELPLLGDHARGLVDLAPIHRNPWGRLLVCQAIAEDLTLVTADASLGRYGPRVMVV